VFGWVICVDNNGRVPHRRREQPQPLFIGPVHSTLSTHDVNRPTWRLLKFETIYVATSKLPFDGRVQLGRSHFVGNGVGVITRTFIYDVGRNRNLPPFFDHIEQSIRFPERYRRKTYSDGGSINNSTVSAVKWTELFTRRVVIYVFFGPTRFVKRMRRYNKRSNVIYRGSIIKLTFRF